MLQLFRRIIGSKGGVIAVLVFLVVIALAFAGGDVLSLRNTGGGSAGGAIAKVGGETIDAAAARLAAGAQVETLKQSEPTMSMAGFLAAGGLNRVVTGLSDRAALQVWGKQYGIVAGDRLIDSEIAKLPAFQGPDGKFSQTVFQDLMKQRGISEAMVRKDIGQSLVERQLMLPASYGATMSGSMALRYAQLLKERRTGMIAVFPAPLFVPPARPDDNTLAAFYQLHRATFIRPERRVIRYATLDEAALKTPVAPSEAAIAARYQANAAQYAALETRALTQLIVPSQDVARAVAADVGKGQTLGAVAEARGLATSTVGPLTKSAFAEQTSAPVADAVFGAAKGTIAPPARSALGWHVVRIDTVVTQPARTLAQARSEIVAALAIEQHRKALADLAAKVEDEFDSGGSITEIAKALGLTVAASGALTADGAVYGKTGEQTPPVLARVLKTAFAMEQENQPQIAEVDPGKTFVLFDVSQIAPSAPAPLGEIKNDVLMAYMLDRGAATAGETARKVLAETKRGVPLDKAVAAVTAALKRPLPPAQPVSMSRDELAAMQQQSRQPAPPPLSLLFSMAQGTSKLLAAPGGRGWFVVSLRQIAPAEVKPDDPLVASARTELGKVVAGEYSEALRRAIRTEVGVTRNEAAIQALRRDLGGGADR